jgi:hypothetical protein
MTARVLEYLTSLLPPWSGHGGDHGGGSLGRIDGLLRDYESLGGDRQAEVARALAQLWDSFVEHFGGIEGFLTGDEARRGDYIERMETAARRMRTAMGSEKGHYFFATAMLTHYLRILYEGAHGRDDQQIANVVVTLVDRGRQLLPPPNGEMAGAH